LASASGSESLSTGCDLEPLFSEGFDSFRVVEGSGKMISPRLSSISSMLVAVSSLLAVVEPPSVAEFYFSD
jgi:hypothetical protein